LPEVPAEEAETEEPEEDTGEPEGSEEPEESEQDEEFEEGEAEEIEEPVLQFDDPEIQAFLARYQGDLERALKGAIELQRHAGRLGQDKSVLARQVQELQEQLDRQQRFSQHTYLTEEQQSWVENAVESGSPRDAVKIAIDAGEFELARAVCESWAEQSPYEAARVAAQVDQVEQRYSQQVLVEQQAEQKIDYPQLLEILERHYPQMPQFKPRMVELLNSLGEDNMLVQEARSNDPEAAARGLIGLYEIARASSATVKQARTRVREEQRDAAEQARANGVVSSAQATPSPGEAPRSRARVTPGLTLEDLDKAFENA
jgi:hypothetical protein